MSAFAERVLANVREEIRDEVAYALELAGEPELLEALKWIVERDKSAASAAAAEMANVARAAIAKAELRRIMSTPTGAA